MKKELAISLKEQANIIAERFSNPDRQANYNNETFAVNHIKVLSEDSAAVIFKKSSNKYGVMFFYYMHVFKKWYSFFPTDSHIMGMAKFGDVKDKYEELNFEHNF